MPLSPPDTDLFDQSLRRRLASFSARSPSGACGAGTAFAFGATVFDEEADVVIKCGGGASDGGCGPSIDKSCAWSVASCAWSVDTLSARSRTWRFAHSFEPIASSRDSIWGVMEGATG